MIKSIKLTLLSNSLCNMNRNMIILPHHIGKIYSVHNGKEFTKLVIFKEMLYHKLGEFIRTKKTPVAKKQKNRKRKKK